MSTNPEVVLCLQAGLPEYPDVEYGVNIAILLQAPMKFLCMRGKAGTSSLEQAVAQGTEKLLAAGLSFEVEWAKGSVPEAIEIAVRDHPQALAVFSDRNRPMWRRMLRLGRFRHLMADVSSPLLRLRDTCWPLKEIMVCSGGMAYTIRLEKMAIRLAKASGARLTLLHIVEPVTLDYSLAREMHDHWSELIETHTPQARHFIQSIAIAKEAGVEARLLVRHGQVVQEIIQEAKTGAYDMIGLGSAYSSRSLRGLYRPDVTALVSASVDCPILTMRGKASDTFEQES
ncbi:MAG TPA: universal stress protein [Bellilinea sp.]